MRNDYNIAKNDNNIMRNDNNITKNDNNTMRNDYNIGKNDNNNIRNDYNIGKNDNNTIKNNYNIIKMTLTPSKTKRTPMLANNPKKRIRHPSLQEALTDQPLPPFTFTKQKPEC